jgi:DNA replication and repair protein RecF
LVWVKTLALRDVRNLQEQTVELSPGLNLFLGANAQGKTSLLEAVALLARGRSFRTDDLHEVVGRGRGDFEVRGAAVGADRDTDLAFRWTPTQRLFSVDRRAATPRDYHGRLEASVYSTARLRIVHGSMRDRRQYLDRAGSALSVAYRETHREYERIVRQRNGALETRRGDAEAWDERLVAVGGRLRARRLDYVCRLNHALATAFRPDAESYEIVAEPEERGLRSEAEHQDRLRAELRLQADRERAARRCLVGPHRDKVHLRVNGEEAAVAASSGQVRSLLLALTEANLRVYREQTGHAAVALLDDLDSELDAVRAASVCRTIAEQGQALVTSAHPEWASRLGDGGRVFRVCAGRATVC